MRRKDTAHCFLGLLELQRMWRELLASHPCGLLSALHIQASSSLLPMLVAMLALKRCVCTQAFLQ